MSSLSPESLAIATLVACEEAIAELYQRYAQQHTELTSFWTQLASDEHRHAQLLREILPKVHQGEVTFLDETMKPELYRTFLDYLRQQVTAVMSQAIPEFTALSIARDIEGTIVEKSYYQVFTTRVPDVIRVIETMVSESSRHHQQIEAQWQQYRPAERPRQRPADSTER